MEVEAEVPRPQQFNAETQGKGATAVLEAMVEDVEVSRKTTRAAAVDEVTEDEERDSEVKTGTVHTQEIIDKMTDGRDGNRN